MRGLGDGAGHVARGLKDRARHFALRLLGAAPRLQGKRVYRIYCELELNLRIKPRKRLKRERPDELAVPETPNEIWSMDFMADRLGYGRQFICSGSDVI